MVKIVGRTKTADFSVDPGCLKANLIFSSDFTGKVQGVDMDGATDASLEFGGHGDQLGEIKVVVTTGSVRVFTEV